MDNPNYELTIKDKFAWMPVSRRLIVGFKETWDEEEMQYSHTFLANPKLINKDWLWRRFEEGCLGGYTTYNFWQSKLFGLDAIYVFPG